MILKIKRRGSNYCIEQTLDVLCKGGLGIMLKMLRKGAIHKIRYPYGVGHVLRKQNCGIF